MEKSIYHSCIIYNCFKQLNLCRIFSHTTIKHMMAVLVSAFSLGCKGKTVNFSMHSPCHRTTLAHFLSHGKWDDSLLDDILKASVVQMIYQETVRSQKTVFCIVNQCQIRSSRGIRRYSLLTSLAHFLCCTADGRKGSFENGYSFFNNRFEKSEPAILINVASIMSHSNRLLNWQGNFAQFSGRFIGNIKKLTNDCIGTISNLLIYSNRITNA